MSNYDQSPRDLTCPARTRATDWITLTDSHISYFASLDATERTPQAVLSGDRNLEANGVPIQSGLFMLTTNSVVTWSRTMHKLKGNVALGDGGIQRLEDARLPDKFLPSEVGSNRLLFP